MHKKIVFRDTQLDDSIRVLEVSPEDYLPEDVQTPETPHMFLIYPGMTDFQEVELTREIAEPGYCYVRPVGADNAMKVHTSRLVDRETALERTHTQIIEQHDDMGRWTTVEKSVTA